ncbi:Transmembrane emp24 domain-containing protein bai [Armadillidium nasatum]|uniref:Transmembrane emp24 domain-containing protein bai n=1 Tax=Armadillidium nasatum TaxID=96803 RepID=A0A5N5T7P0_9CRUS|nr:Transmembrane emp24 domain-containing protein bai [Armadillidium nasatum]
MASIYSFVFQFLFIYNLISQSFQVMFHLQPNGQKCLREEIHKDVLVSGEYDIQQTPGQNVEIQVTDSSGQILYSKTEAGTGKFLFNTEHNDAYEICFMSRVTPSTVRGIKQEVSIKTKHGVEAKSYERVKLQVETIRSRITTLRRSQRKHCSRFCLHGEREQEMRTQKSTNSRVLYFSLFSLCILIGLATWQVLYLRKFFKAKKLIE